MSGIQGSPHTQRDQQQPWARSHSVVGSRSVFIIRQDFQTEFHQFCKKLCRWGPFRAAQCICKLCSFLGTSNSTRKTNGAVGWGMVKYPLAIPQTDELRNLLSSSGMTFEFLSVHIKILSTKHLSQVGKINPGPSTLKGWAPIE